MERGILADCGSTSVLPSASNMSASGASFGLDRVFLASWIQVGNLGEEAKRIRRVEEIGRGYVAFQTIRACP